MDKVIGKYIDVAIRFDSPCLADYWPGPPRDHCVFFRNNDECIVLRHRHLFAMLTKAKALINSPIDIRKVDFVTTVVADTQVIHAQGVGGAVAKHEAIVPQTEAWLSFGLESDINYEAFMALMRAAGTDVGLSPALSAEGYGRFTVLEGIEEWLSAETTPQL